MNIPGLKMIHSLTWLEIHQNLKVEAKIFERNEGYKADLYAAIKRANN